MAIIKTLKVITHPQGARYNATFSTQPIVHVGDLDTTTSVFTIDAAFVGSVLVAEGPGNTGYNLSGTLSKTFVNGVATFTDLGIVPDSTNTTLDVAAASLSFVTVNLNVVTSNNFQISNASKLVVTSTPVPTTTTLGRIMQIPVKVQFRDADNNNIPLSGISIVASAQGATMSGTTTLQSGALGFVIFTQLTFSGGSQVIVTFSSPGMTSAVLTINLIPTNIIKPRRSIVAGDFPVVGDIVPFEIAINIPDRQLWVADQTGTPVLIVDGDANTSGGGEGVVSSGALGKLAYYASSGTTVDDLENVSWDSNTLNVTGAIHVSAQKNYLRFHWDTLENLNTDANPVPWHGMLAHVHATGRVYVAHNGAWTPLAMQSDITSGGGGGGGGSSTSFSTGSTAPSSPAQGDRWVSTNDAILYTYYGVAWVQFNT